MWGLAKDGVGSVGLMFGLRVIPDRRQHRPRRRFRARL
jgi:hypothetical protein